MAINAGGSCQRRRKCGRRQRTREEHKAANTEERNMSGMREYLTGRSDGRKGAHPRETEGREPHATREDATATKHTNHKPEGTKRASGVPTHASMREQGMAREPEPEPAASNTTGIEGPRMDKEIDVNNAATPAHPPTGKLPRNPPSSLFLEAINAGGSITQQAGLPAHPGCFVKTLGLSPSCLPGVGRLLRSPCTGSNKVARYARRMVHVVRT